MSKKPFIVIEALDAGGSQTQTDRLVKKLRQERFNVLSLHFPQEDRATGRMIYDKFLLSKNKLGFSKREQALLYIQDFYASNEDIRRHISGQGKRAVVSDRFCTSTVAYQTIGLTGAERVKMYKWIMDLCFADKPTLLKPDLVIFIDTPVDVSLSRLSKKKKDYFENKKKLTAIRSSYLKVAKQQGWKIVSGVDGQGKERTRSDISREIWVAVESVF